MRPLAILTLVCSLFVVSEKYRLWLSLFLHKPKHNREKFTFYFNFLKFGIMYFFKKTISWARSKQSTLLHLGFYTVVSVRAPFGRCFPHFFCVGVRETKCTTDTIKK